jgi:hypothetical protein
MEQGTGIKWDKGPLSPFPGQVPIPAAGSFASAVYSSCDKPSLRLQMAMNNLLLTS